MVVQMFGGLLMMVGAMASIALLGGERVPNLGRQLALASGCFALGVLLALWSAYRALAGA